MSGLDALCVTLRRYLCQAALFVGPRRSLFWALALSVSGPGILLRRPGALCVGPRRSLHRDASRSAYERCTHGRYSDYIFGFKRYRYFDGNNFFVAKLHSLCRAPALSVSGPALSASGPALHHVQLTKVYRIASICLIAIEFSD